MSGYTDNWTPKTWKVVCGGDNASIKVNDNLEFKGEGQGSMEDQLVNKSNSPNNTWLSGFSYDSAEDKVSKEIKDAMGVTTETLVIRRSPSDMPNRFRLTCRHFLPTSSLASARKRNRSRTRFAHDLGKGDNLTGTSGGVCWIAEEGG